MANLAFYNNQFNISTIDGVCQLLLDTFIETNHTYQFFVNFEKAVQNRDVFKYELALLKSLRHSSNEINDFQVLLRRYPEVIKVIPILIACRDGIIKILDVIEPQIQYKAYNFSKDKYTDDELDQIVEFAHKTGLLNALCHMDSATDYLLGIEVGLDTHSRKQRSGLFLEKIVDEIIGEFVSNTKDINWVKQKNFKYIASNFKINIPPSLSNRKFDNVLIINNKAAMNIEVNFYGGSGSKPGEIVSSYINRGEVLSAAGWKFVWVTDGVGWKSMTNSLHVGVENIDYVINTHLLRTGILNKIINLQGI